MSQLEDFIQQRAESRQGQASLILYQLFIITNRIESAFNRDKDELSLKQFMLLILVKILGQANLSESASILGISR